MKLTAKVNGVQQEIELSKEDVYVVECGGDSEKVNKVLKITDVEDINTLGWKYVSNKPLFRKDDWDFGKYVTDTEPIPPNTPIISFEDWERLMECKELPKEFCFVCDENSKEQLEKLGVITEPFFIPCDENDFGLYFYVQNNKIVYGGFDNAHIYFSKDERYNHENYKIISLADYLPMESDKEEPKPTKWRFKTQKEFDDTCKKNERGDYRCGDTYFVEEMFHLFGKEYAGSPDNLIRHDHWIVSPEMLMPLEEQPEPSRTISGSDSLKFATIPNATTNNTTEIKAVEFKTLGTTQPTTYYPIFFRAEPHKTLLSIQTKPKSEIVFKDKVIAYEQLEQLLLSVDLPSKQPEPKWQEKTRGGYEYHIYEEFDGYMWGRIKISGTWITNKWNLDGSYNDMVEIFDLVPLNRESILKEIEEHKKAIVELEKKLL